MKFAAAALFASALAVAFPAHAEILIKVDKAAQQMTVIRDGDVVDRWPVSTGRGGYATPSGSFKPFRMEVDHHSDEWDDAPMPHSIFFTQKGHAIHGTYETRHLGSAVSHGCVRISAAHATELFAMVKADGMANTKVVITGGGDEDAVTSRRRGLGTDGLGLDAPYASAGAGYDAGLGDGVEAPSNRVFFTPRY